MVTKTMKAVGKVGLSIEGRMVLEITKT